MKVCLLEEVGGTCALDLGFKPDPHWTWVAIKDGEQVGALAGGGLQGMFFLMRLQVAKDKAPHITTLTLLRKAFKCAKQRGLAGVVTMLSVDQVNEVKLGRVAARHGSVFVPFRGVVAAMPLESRFVR